MSSSPPEAYITPHACEAYYRFYPEAALSDILSAYYHSTEVEPEAVVALCGRRSLQTRNDDTYWLHPERSGIFVVSRRRIEGDEDDSDPRRASWKPFVCITFLRFVSLEQYKQAVTLFGERESLTAHTNYLTEVRPDIVSDPLDYRRVNPIPWSSYTLTITKGARRLGIVPATGAGQLGALNWRPAVGEERAAASAQRSQTVWITQWNGVCLRLIVDDTSGVASVGILPALDTPTRPRRLNPQTVSVCRSLAELYPGLSWDGCVREVRLHLARSTPTQCLDEQGLVWTFSLKDTGLHLYQPYPGQWHVGRRVLNLSAEVQAACRVLVAAGIGIELPEAP